MSATIKRIVRRYKRGEHPITEVELEGGGEVYTGYGWDWEVGEEVIDWHNERFDKLKIAKHPHHINTIDKSKDKD